MKELNATSIPEIRRLKNYKQTLKSEQLKNAILNSLSAQIAVLSSDGTIETVNESWKLFEIENSSPELRKLDFVGMNYLKICKESPGRFSQEAMKAFRGILSVLKGSTSSFTLEYPCNSPAKKRWFLLSVTGLPGAHGAVVSHTDITDRKEVEQMKEDFISIASHELKTPLTSLKALIHIFHLSFLKQMKGDGAKLLNIMDAQLDKLTKVIKDVLDVSTMQGGALPLIYEEFDFSALVQETVKNIPDTPQLHFLLIQENESIIYRGDRLRLQKVIANILTNAVKYSPEANQVLINSVISDDNILLSVQDFGIGVDRENLTRIFERFYPSNGGLKFGGLGLGLYISKEIIKAHKGKLWVESQEGKGSIFYFLLPINKK